MRIPLLEVILHVYSYCLRQRRDRLRLTPRGHEGAQCQVRGLPNIVSGPGAATLYLLESQAHGSTRRSTMPGACGSSRPGCSSPPGRHDNDTTGSLRCAHVRGDEARNFGSSLCLRAVWAPSLLWESTRATAGARRGEGSRRARAVEGGFGGGGASSVAACAVSSFAIRRGTGQCISCFGRTSGASSRANTDRHGIRMPSTAAKVVAAAIACPAAGVSCRWSKRVQQHASQRD